MSKTTARRMLFIALAGWAVAWILPAYRAIDTPYGWMCFKLATIQSIGIFDRKQPLTVVALLMDLSPWTNYLVPAGMLALHRGRPRWLRRNVGVLLLVSFGINLAWHWGKDIERDGLSIGYYLWLASYLVLGISVLLLLRQPGSDSDSVLLNDQTGSGREKAVTAGAGLILLVLVAIAASAYFPGKAETPPAAKLPSPLAVTPTPTPVPSAPDPEEARRRRLAQIVPFIKGYTGDVRANETGENYLHMKFNEMYSNLEIDGCDLSVEHAFYDNLTMTDHLYRVNLYQLSPSVSTQARFSINAPLHVPTEFSIVGIRLLARNSGKVIEVLRRQGKRNTESESYGNFTAWEPTTPVDEIFVGVSKIDPARVAKAFDELVRVCGGVDEPF